ncbi:MAG: hypothetical protein QNJ34_10905 [Xenococcaceae cyanobacterium MO_188.B29]|nr:hypothetical protein [Xenococcaceae cyanobacterium MO_188.B29]
MSKKLSKFLSVKVSIAIATPGKIRPVLKIEVQERCDRIAYLRRIRKRIEGVAEVQNELFSYLGCERSFMASLAKINEKFKLIPFTLRVQHFAQVGESAHRKCFTFYLLPQLDQG